MALRIAREEARHMKKVMTDASGQKVLKSNHQTVAVTSRPVYYNIPIQPPPPSNAFSSGKTLLMDLDPHECGEITDIDIRFTISCTTADVEIVPGPHLIKQIVVESNKIQDEIARLYPEVIMAGNYMYYDGHHRRQLNKQQMIKPVCFESEGSEKYWSDARNNTIAAGTTKEVILTLPLGFLKLESIDGQHNQ